MVPACGPGAVLGERQLVDLLARQLGPWSLNGPARYLMAKALLDSDWQARAVADLQAASSRLGDLLQRQGLAAASGTLLFRYVRHPRAARIADDTGPPGDPGPPVRRAGRPEVWLAGDRSRLAKAGGRAGRTDISH